METLNYVDLGLESGTLWATCNVGANAPEEYGDYFAWGETTPKSTYSWRAYKHIDDNRKFSKYCNNSDYGKDGFTDGKMVLDAEDDAATVNWGSDWRMPTKEEIDELIRECQWKWTTIKGKNGYRATGPNGNSIFLPAAGFRGGYNLNGVGRYSLYWSSTLLENNPCGAYVVDLDYDYVDLGDYYRRNGQPVRPVRNLKSISK